MTALSCRIALRPFAPRRDRSAKSALLLWPSLPRQRLLDLLHPLAVRLRQSLEKPVRANFQGHADANKLGERKGNLAELKVTDAVPVDADEFGEAFLGDVGRYAGLADSTG